MINLIIKQKQLYKYFLQNKYLNCYTFLMKSRVIHILGHTKIFSVCACFLFFILILNMYCISENNNLTIYFYICILLYGHYLIFDIQLNKQRI